MKGKIREFFYDRTKNHIEAVKKYCIKLVELDSDAFGELLERGKVHDSSKLEEPELIPYMYITWKHKCRTEGKPCNFTKEIEELMNEATLHHVKTNTHHPEYYDEKAEIAKYDRDAIPDKIINATSMPEIDIAEMCCDWCAMADERGTDPIKWADRTVNKRWKFTKNQVDLIYTLLDYLWS